MNTDRICAIAEELSEKLTGLSPSQRRLVEELILLARAEQAPPAGSQEPQVLVTPPGAPALPVVQAPPVGKAGGHKAPSVKPPVVPPSRP